MGIVCGVLETVYEPYAHFFLVFMLQLLNIIGYNLNIANSRTRERVFRLSTAVNFIIISRKCVILPENR